MKGIFGKVAKLRLCNQVLALAHQLSPSALRKGAAEALWDDLRYLLDMQVRLFWHATIPARLPVHVPRTASPGMILGPSNSSCLIPAVCGACSSLQGACLLCSMPLPCSVARARCRVDLPL